MCYVLFILQSTLLIHTNIWIKHLISKWKLQVLMFLASNEHDIRPQTTHYKWLRWIMETSNETLFVNDVWRELWQQNATQVLDWILCSNDFLNAYSQIHWRTMLRCTYTYTHTHPHTYADTESESKRINRMGFMQANCSWCIYVVVNFI